MTYLFYRCGEEEREIKQGILMVHRLGNGCGGGICVVMAVGDMGVILKVSD